MKKMLVCAVVVLGSLAQSAWAGGQQVTAQAAADGKSVVVRTFRCGTPSSFAVLGTAEGIVAGAAEVDPADDRPLPARKASSPWRGSGPRKASGCSCSASRASTAVSTLVELEPGATLRIARQKTTYEKPTPAEVHAVLASAARAAR